MKSGDKITVVSIGSNVYLATVGTIYVGRFRWIYGLDGYSEEVKLAEEGITWIHGRHARNSYEAEALLVAHALGEVRHMP